MTEFRFLAQDESDTDRLGKHLAEVLPPGCVIALNGTLGAGKTRLVQAVAAGMGIPREAVTSPTFVLVNEYVGGRLPIYHFDTYRLCDEDEFIELGPEEYFSGRGITFVEWAERFETCLPAERVTVHIEVLGASEREFAVSANSASLNSIVDELGEKLVAKGTR
ncbi:tRNA (adenosine(37)-N6)-threonylcarbamoyltransferase complex ATPase subunit type 1 TsaE [Bythopirellula polymerisocia]|uniref:tRNA threonylcarbamoyladenosine biosynthesis protein TsaE n=1 Tax=Bythopirellula polymerisocia TaxID=2528003 RepID=A0A5C6C9V5_9BACT|nr:tRNA (adenosine(37)-N6)-threonylcarbamoyltransferase complex ATPase subunit type 1 TsaE [Bythopirellula polymerisocia]TWU20855.1 tRNA threonylcarbamoyladenosine biosynthesis protein TsaE [Bythopirellula polymerisocia]